MQVALSEENESRIGKLAKKHAIYGVVSKTKLANAAIAVALKDELARKEPSAAFELEILNSK